MSNRLLDIITEPDNTITAMLKTGDYIYYRSKEFGLYPTIVERVSGDRVRCSGPKGRQIWVAKRNCQLQEEWIKENEQ